MHRSLRKQELQEVLRASLHAQPARQLVQEGTPLSSARAAVGFLCATAPTGELSFLLTQRSEHLEHHAGEVCLPGGHVDATDADDRATLDREFFEEVGIPFGAIEWEVSLDELRSRGGTLVTLWVGFLKAESEPALQFNEEVVAAKWCPVSQLFDAKLWTFKDIPTGAPSRTLEKYPFWDGFRPQVWGLTAIFLWLLKERLEVTTKIMR